MAETFKNLGLNLPTVVAYLVNVAVLFVVLWRLLYKPVRKFLDERESRYARRAEEIERRDHDTQEEKAKYEQLMANVQEDSDALLRESRVNANRRAEDIIARAEEQAEELLRHARREIAEEKRLARLEMREEIVELAVDMAARILEREVSADDHKRIVDRFLDSEKVG